MEGNGKKLWHIQQFWSGTHHFLSFWIFWYVSKLVNSSLLKQLSANILRWRSWSEHLTSSIGTSLFTLNWLEGSALLVIDGLLSVIHVKLGIFQRFCPLFQIFYTYAVQTVCSNTVVVTHFYHVHVCFCVRTVKSRFKVFWIWDFFPLPGLISGGHSQTHICNGKIFTVWDFWILAPPPFKAQKCIFCIVLVLQFKVHIYSLVGLCK